MNREQVEQAIEKLRFKFPYSVDEWVTHPVMENYHCHKDFSNVSVPDCAETIENYAFKTLTYGGKCLFSGDHGNQGNQFHVYKVAEQNGLKYRHSAEVYWVKDRHEKDRTNCHMVIVAKNPEGRKDLNYILSIANEDGYYYQPRIDLELLLSVDPDNFIVTSACYAGHKYEDSDEIWLKIADYFGDNFFFEVQNHNTEKQKKLNRHLADLAKEHNIQLIAGLDSHYVDDANAVKREQIQKYKRVEYNDDESGWFMDFPDCKETIRRFKEQGVLTDDEILQAVLNTNVFVNECEETVFDRHFKIPNVYPDKSYDERVKILKKIVNDAYKKDPLRSKEKADGIRWETQQYIESNTVDYPLLSRAIIKLAKEKYGGILTTTSRGSMSSFVSNKLIGMTTIDRYTAEIPMYPERFLTKERIIAGAMPDCDLNVVSQEPFLKASRELLGVHGCYPLMAVSKLKEKAAWQLYAGANGVEPSIQREVSKYIDAYNDKIKHADADDVKFIKIDDYIPKDLLPIYKESREYQNITIGLGVHACGHLLLDKDIRREIGLITAKSETTGKRTLCACVEGKYLDEFGYVKEDFLIVDSVGLTHEMFDAINQPVPTFEDLKKMVAGDKDTWNIYTKGITCCINQCEKSSTTKKLMKYKPQNIGELSAFIAGIRPGFASLINNFLERKPYSTGEPKIDEILEDSQHYLLYQESIMKVLGFLGQPMNETYKVIKSISKKKLKGKMKDDLLSELKDSWLKEFGNLNNFDKVWKVIEDSAAYGFNSCVSGDTKIQKLGYGKNQYNPTVAEMYLIMNDRKYATRTGHVGMHGKYHRNGYGTALSMYDDRFVRNNKIVNIYQKGIKDIYRVMTEDESYVDCTMDHKFPTPNGIKHLEELSVGDELYTKKLRIMRWNGIPSQKSKIKSIEFLKTDMTYDIEMEGPAHNFVTESGLIVSNCHAYAMAGDSLYLAWFKAHYPATFYEVAIRHYQKKKNKDKIDALIKEAMKFYKMEYGKLSFGNDNRQVNIDKETNTIYPNLSSIKGIGDSVADELYKISTNNHPEDFLDVIKLIDNSSINKTVFDKLIKIGYFDQFGSSLKLLKAVKMYRLLGGAKVVKFSKVESLGLDISSLEKYGNKTNTQISKFDGESFIKDYWRNLPDEIPSTWLRCKWENEVVGLISVTDDSMPNNYYYVAEIEEKPKLIIVNLYNPKHGKYLKVKQWKTKSKNSPYDVGDVLKITNLKKKEVRESTGAVDEKTGKKVYVSVPGKYEYFIEDYMVIERGDSIVR